jgi:hypothetical protein
MERRVSSQMNKAIHTLASELAGRMMLAGQLGLQYNGSRDVYKALGYKEVLVFNDFLGRYLRQDIAKAVIDRPVKATWQGALELIETNNPKQTEFEKAWVELNRKFELKSRLTRVDRLTGIGRYGVLLLGLDDVGKPEDFMKPIRAGERKLLYVKPFSEKTALIDDYVIDPKDERYGLPLIYSIQVSDMASGSSYTVKVHYSRVIHIVDDSLESEVMGTPRLEAVFNRLYDLEKIVGGDAEMFWRGARPGFQGATDKDFTMTKATQDDLLNQLDEYEHDLRRFLVTEGVDIKPLAQQIANPSANVDVQLTMISAVTGIPKRILMGSERGELSSAQDSKEWKTYVQARREDHAEPRIIRPFVDRLIELKILPKPTVDYKIDWLDLFAVSEKERVEIGKIRASAIREYMTNPMAQALMPPDAFFELCLGLSTGQIELNKKMIEVGISEEQKDLMEEIDEITAPPEPTGGFGQSVPGGTPIPGGVKKPVRKIIPK